MSHDEKASSDYALILFKHTTEYLLFATIDLRSWYPNPLRDSLFKFYCKIVIISIIIIRRSQELSHSEIITLLTLWQTAASGCVCAPRHGDGNAESTSALLWFDFAFCSVLVCSPGNGVNPIKSFDTNAEQNEEREWKSEFRPHHATINQTRNNYEKKKIISQSKWQQ